MDIAVLEQQLNSFDPDARRAALRELAAHRHRFARVKQEVNLHLHTFFSYNANGWSPSRIAWEARKYGLAVAGIVDFDVLDGVEEFLSAGGALGLPTTAALETRVFIDEYLDHVISSPNEPGIAYFMAGGCFRLPAPNSQAARTLTSMKEMARRRNIEVMNRVNNYLDTVQIDYDAEVLPLTPSGNATERHMLAAYDAKSRQVLGDAHDLADFWATKLDMSFDSAQELIDDTPRFHETIRSRLMKHGGVGYVPPRSDSFPKIETVIEMARGMDALPTATWLDGTSSGESDLPALLGLLVEKGVVALNTIPDRNWNIKDPSEKRLKLRNLAEAVRVAEDLALPLCVGTEMNKLGLPFVDNFAAAELRPFVKSFLDGAFFFWGHTFLARNAAMGYASEWSQAHFGGNRHARNTFYADVGRIARPADSVPKMNGLSAESSTPDDVIRALQ